LYRQDGEGDKTAPSISLYVVLAERLCELIEAGHHNAPNYGLAFFFKAVDVSARHRYERMSDMAYAVRAGMSEGKSFEEFIKALELWITTKSK